MAKKKRQWPKEDVNGNYHRILINQLFLYLYLQNSITQINRNTVETLDYGIATHPRQKTILLSMSISVLSYLTLLCNVCRT